MRLLVAVHHVPQIKGANLILRDKQQQRDRDADLFFQISLK